LYLMMRDDERAACALDAQFRPVVTREGEGSLCRRYSRQWLQIK